jgi:hypothetical protein
MVSLTHRFVGLFWLLLLAVGQATGQDLAPPARHHELAPKRADAAGAIPTALPLALAPGRVVALPPPTADETAAWDRLRADQAAGARQGKPRRLPVGFARQVPKESAEIRLDTLSWRVVGSWQLAHVALQSPGASGLRIETEARGVDERLVLRFQGSRGAITEAWDLRALEQAGQWSPLLDGEVAMIELAIPVGTAPAGTLTIRRISHLAMNWLELKADSRIGMSGACNVDVACATGTLKDQLATAKDAVARIFFTNEGSTFGCTGTLLNDTVSSKTPYLFTASHCLDDGNEEIASHPGRPAAVAKTFVTYWFFEAQSCGSRTQPPSLATLSSGAQLLARSNDHDWALVRLNGALPSGVMFAGWNATASAAAGTDVASMHHPSGDLKKISIGSSNGNYLYQGRSKLVEVGWRTGVTETGSSGSGLFTWNSNGYLELRGGLLGGLSSCDVPTGSDFYSRMDVGFPHLIPYLYPTRNNPAKTFSALEFYNATSNAYVLAVNAQDAAAYDAKSGWVRTGLGFLVYTDGAVAAAGAAPACALKSGEHSYYSTSPIDCASTLNSGGWTQLSAAAFHILPGSAGCPADTTAVYRMHDGREAKRFRFVSDQTVRDSLQSSGWTAEAVAFCAAQASPNEGGGSATTAQVIEYYHAAMDHYFITAIPAEIAAIDGGAFQGWARTGKQFKTYAAVSANALPVCRFFSNAFGSKSSHFYTVSPTECEAVKKLGTWTFEGGDVLAMGTPSASGICAAGTIPVYRLYNDGQGGAPNHRFTTELAVRQQMLDRGWIPEGYGSVGVTMCSPQ